MEEISTTTWLSLGQNTEGEGEGDAEKEDGVDKKSKRKELFKRIGIISLFIVAWYVMSDALILYNDWLMIAHRFNFPIFMTFYHMSSTFFCSRVLFTSPLYRQWDKKMDKILLIRPNEERSEEREEGGEGDIEEEEEEEERTERLFGGRGEEDVRTRKTRCSKCFSCVARFTKNLGGSLPILALAVTFVGDITFANAAFSYVKVSTVEVINSCSVLFVFVLGVLFTKTEQFDWRTFITLICIIVGSGISSLDDFESDLYGIILAFLSTVLGSFKSVLIARLILPLGKQTPMQLLSNFTIPASIIALILVFSLEKEKLILSDSDYGFFSTLSFVALNGFMAFLLNWTAFAVIGATSALTYEVLGSFKDMFVFVAALVFLKESMSVMNVVGNLIMTFGILGYTLCRFFIMEHQVEVHLLSRLPDQRPLPE